MAANPADTTANDIAELANKKPRGAMRGAGLNDIDWPCLAQL